MGCPAVRPFSLEVAEAATVQEFPEIMDRVSRTWHELEEGAPLRWKYHFRKHFEVLLQSTCTVSAEGESMEDRNIRRHAVRALGIGCIVLFLLPHGLGDEKSTAEHGTTLLDARRGFHTKLTPNNYKPDGPAPAPSEPTFRLIHYPSPAGNLVAYLSKDPGDGKKHPALLWAHGGFGGIGKGDEEAPLTVHIVKGGDHFNILSSLSAMAVKKIPDDVGDTCAVKVTREEVLKAFANRASSESVSKRE